MKGRERKVGRRRGWEGRGREGSGGEGRAGEGKNDLTHPLSQIPGYATHSRCTTSTTTITTAAASTSFSLYACR